MEVTTITPFLFRKRETYTTFPKNIKRISGNLKISGVADLLFLKSVIFQKSKLRESNLILRDKSAQTLIKLPKFQVVKLQRRVNIDRG